MWDGQRRDLIIVPGEAELWLRSIKILEKDMYIIENQIM